MANTNRKQLAVLLIASTWISLAVYAAYDSYQRVLSVDIPEFGPAFHAFAYTLVKMFAWSLPAILFGGIGFWWFGRQKG